MNKPSKCTVLCTVTRWSLVGMHQLLPRFSCDTRMPKFGGSSFVCLQGNDTPEEGGSRSLRNSGTYLPVCMVPPDAIHSERAVCCCSCSDGTASRDGLPVSTNRKRYGRILLWFNYVTILTFSWKENYKNFNLDTYCLFLPISSSSLQFPFSALRLPIVLPFVSLLISFLTGNVPHFLP